MSDLFRLKVGDVRGKTEVIIQEQKTKKRRTVFLHTIMPEIAEYVEGKSDEEYLFASERTGRPISRTQAYRVFQKAADWIGREDIGTHTLRKTFGYHYYQQTKDIGTLMIILNHSSEVITKRYLNVIWGLKIRKLKNNLKRSSYKKSTQRSTNLCVLF